MQLEMSVPVEDVSHFMMPRVVMISFGQGLPPFSTNRRISKFSTLMII